MATINITGSGSIDISDTAVLTEGDDIITFGEGHRMSLFDDRTFGATQHKKVTNGNVNIFNKTLTQQDPTWTKVE